MLFSSYTFLFFFLPITVGLFYLTRKLAGRSTSLIYIIVASLVFYGLFYPGFLIILPISIIFNLIFALLLKRTKYMSRFILIIGIIVNLMGIVFFRYSDLLNNIDYFPQNMIAMDWIYPLGIGFLTFNQISYLVQIYKGESTVIFNLDYCLKCTFFPSLVMGPVYQYKDNIVAENDVLKPFDAVAQGSYILIIGLFKMVVLADSFYIYVFNGLNINNPGLFTSWFTLISFSLQIYFYFSGYCDLATGIGRMFGFNIPYNFLSPFKATSIGDFLSRWHISLISILKEVIYHPLTAKSNNILIKFIVITVTSIIGSLWYGISFKTLIFGFALGVLLSIENLFKKIITHVPNGIGRGITFLILNLLFILLPTTSAANSFQIYKGLIDIKNPGLEQLTTLASEGSLYFPDFVNVGYLILTVLLGMLLCFFGKNTKEMMKNASFTILSAVGLSLLFLIVVIHLTRLEFLF